MKKEFYKYYSIIKTIRYKSHTLGKSNYITLLLLFSTFFSLIISCGKKEEVKEEILLRVNDKVLTVDDVVEKIPVSLHPSDSLQLFRSIIESWVKDQILTDFAVERLMDTARIEQKVRNYRNQLIVQEYLQAMKDSHKPRIEEREVREYYDSHRNELKTEMPLVKGIFIKINSATPGKNEIRKLLKNNDDNNIDLLEKNWIDVSISYDYFRDRWVEWETVNDQLPLRISDPDDYILNNRYIEIDANDCTYYLQITDYLPSNSEQPYEYASEWIKSILAYSETARYEQELVESLIKQAIKNNKLETPGYDPIKHELITEKN